MKLREFLIKKMTPFSERTAFENSGIKYSDLLRFLTDGLNDGKLELCDGKTKEEQALNIIKCIGRGNVAVPASETYGRNQYLYIKDIVDNDVSTYDDLAFLMFTSGTTGKPKGVMLTDENIISNIGYISDYFDIADCKKICIARPLLHIAVLTGELLFALCNGLTVTFYEESFMPQRLMSFLSASETEIFCATPTLFVLLSGYADKYPTRLRVCAVSGERLTKSGAEIISSAFPKTLFYNVYGLTEHSPRVSALCPSDFVRKAGSVGKPIGSVEVKIEDGELSIHSLCVMKGYFGDEKKTKLKIKNGWLKTGDMAHFDDEGYLYIDGRKDNMIIRSGINIYPESIEDAAMKILGVEDCLVIGQADDTGITKLVMKYIGSANPIEVRKRLTAILDTHFMPDRIEKVEAFEKTLSGKKVRR